MYVQSLKRMAPQKDYGSISPWYISSDTCSSEPSSHWSVKALNTYFLGVATVQIKLNCQWLRLLKIVCLFVKKIFWESLEKIQWFAFRNLVFRLPRTEKASLNFDCILKQEYLSVGSITNQTSVAIVQRMRYAKV